MSSEKEEHHPLSPIELSCDLLDGLLLLEASKEEPVPMPAPTDLTKLATEPAEPAEPIAAEPAEPNATEPAEPAEHQRPRISEAPNPQDVVPEPKAEQPSSESIVDEELFVPLRVPEFPYKPRRLKPSVRALPRAELRKRFRLTLELQS